MQEIVDALLKFGINKDMINVVDCDKVGICTASQKQQGDYDVCFTWNLKDSFFRFFEFLFFWDKKRSLGNTDPIGKHIFIDVRECYLNNTPINLVLKHELVHFKTYIHCGNKECLFQKNHIKTLSPEFCQTCQTKFNEVIKEINENCK
jgi:hypothetical protein